MTTFQTIPSHTSMYQNETMYIMYITWPIGSHDTRPSSCGVTWPCTPTHTLSVICNTHQHIPQFPPDSAFLVLLLAELLIRSPQSLCPGNPFGRAKYFQAAGKTKGGGDWGRKGKVRERKGAREEGRKGGYWAKVITPKWMSHFVPSNGHSKDSTKWLHQGGQGSKRVTCYDALVGMFIPCLQLK